MLRIPPIFCACCIFELEMMLRGYLMIWLIWCCLPAAVSQSFYRIPVHFHESPVPPAPDYHDSGNWAALPGKADPADQTPPGLTDRQASATADVFFVHPTSFIDKPDDSYLWNASVQNTSLNEKTDQGSIRFQASIFNESCRIFAPRYRQAHYFAFFTADKKDKKLSLDLAYTDVRNAFEYYLKTYNNGRPIIIASHSQGTVHAHRLLREFFEGQPLQKQLVVAYLVGMPVPSDSFAVLKPCLDSVQTGCWCSWRTYRHGHMPRWPDDEHIVVTNPLSWSTDSVPVKRRYHKGAVLTDFRKIRPEICDARIHEGVLWVHRPRFPGSRLIRNPNYHVGDYNLFYIDVRENVKSRITHYLKEQGTE